MMSPFHFNCFLWATFFFTSLPFTLLYWTGEYWIFSWGCVIVFLNWTLVSLFQELLGIDYCRKMGVVGEKIYVIGPLFLNWKCFVNWMFIGFLWKELFQNHVFPFLGRVAKSSLKKSWKACLYKKREKKDTQNLDQYVAY